MALGIDLWRMQANDRLAAHVPRQLLHFRVGPFSLHRRERTASVEQVAAGGDKLCELCERTRNHHCKERRREFETLSLPAEFDYRAVRGLSVEAQQKLQQHRPETIGQASRISGITPAAISLLLVHLKRGLQPSQKKTA